MRRRENRFQGLPRAGHEAKKQKGQAVDGSKGVGGEGRQGSQVEIVTNRRIVRRSTRRILENGALEAFSGWAGGVVAGGCRSRLGGVF